MAVKGIKVSDAYGMPEGADLCLGSFELEVDAKLSPAEFRYSNSKTCVSIHTDYCCPALSIHAAPSIELFPLHNILARSLPFFSSIYRSIYVQN